MPEHNIQAEKFFNEHREVFYPPSKFCGYEIVNDSRENLMNIFMLLSGDPEDVSDICFDDKYEFVDSLIEAGFMTGDLEQQYDLTETVSEINKVISKLNYNITLTEEDILSRDDELTKDARRQFRYLTSHDLNVCAELIEAQGYELFQVFLDCGGLTMAILPKSRMADIKKYFDR